MVAEVAVVQRYYTGREYKRGSLARRRLAVHRTSHNNGVTMGEALTTSASDATGSARVLSVLEPRGSQAAREYLDASG